MQADKTKATAKSTYPLLQKNASALEKQYYHLHNLSYSNYKYEKPNLRHSEFEFLAKLPLDDVNKVIVPKQLQVKQAKLEDAIAHKEYLRRMEDYGNQPEGMSS